MVRWERMKTPFVERDREEGAWRLMRVGRTIDDRIRAANRECANERSTCATRSD